MHYMQNLRDWVAGGAPPTPTYLPLERKAQPKSMPHNHSSMAVHTGVAFMALAAAVPARSARPSSEDGDLNAPWATTAMQAAVEVSLAEDPRLWLVSTGPNNTHLPIELRQEEGGGGPTLAHLDLTGGFWALTTRLTLTAGAAWITDLSDPGSPETPVLATHPPPGPHALAWGIYADDMVGRAPHIRQAPMHSSVTGMQIHRPRLLLVPDHRTQLTANPVTSQEEGRHQAQGPRRDSKPTTRPARSRVQRRAPGSHQGPTLNGKPHLACNGKRAEGLA
jgi:hypothetical protein